MIVACRLSEVAGLEVMIECMEGSLHDAVVVLQVVTYGGGFQEEDFVGLLEDLGVLFSCCYT